MNQELTTELANIIRETHYAACRAANDSKASAEEALQHAAQCGGYVDQCRTMTKGRMLGWLRDNVPDLTPERAKAYLSLFHTQAKRQSHELDKQMLLDLGVLNKRVAERQKSIVANQDRWFVHVNKVRAWWGKTTREHPIDKWTDEECATTANQLRPIVEIYQRILERTGGKG
jgi:hypothetical protein